MVKTSKHNVTNDINNDKHLLISTLYNDYISDVRTYINYIIDGNLPLKTNISSKLLPTELLLHSKYKRDAYSQASQTIRSQIKKCNERRYNRYKCIYTYFKTNNRQLSFTSKKYSELYLKDIIKTRYFTIPKLNNITIIISNELYNIQNGNHFDEFISLPINKFNNKGTRAIRVNIPFKHHRHSLKLQKQSVSKANSIGLTVRNGNIIISYFWNIEPCAKRTEGRSIGIDMGYKKLITTSDNEYYHGELTKIYSRISNKQQGSLAFKKSLLHRDNEINRLVNSMLLDDIKTIYCEELKNVKQSKKYYNNKIQRWSYTKTISKLESHCNMYGIELVKVSPEYTSQQCSSCGNINKESRQGEDYKCISCGYEIDADYNASINIHSRGASSLSSKESNTILL